MKKFIALFIAVVMVFAGAVTASAANSPNSTVAPTVVVVVDDNNEPVVDFEIVPYINRGKLDSKASNIFENSYKSLVNTDVIAGLGDSFQNFVSKKGIKINDLAVSDFFFTHYTDGECEKSDKTLSIKLDAESAKKFVALVHYDDNTGKWSVVENAKIDANGLLTFTTNLLGSFSVVTDTLALTRNQASGEQAPKTSDNGVATYLFATVLFAGAVLVCAKELKKVNG